MKVVSGFGMSNLVSCPREWWRKKLSSDAKSASDSGKMRIDKRIPIFSYAMAREPKMEWDLQLKKIAKVPPI
jgi:hypothetical protein